MTTLMGRTLAASAALSATRPLVQWPAVSRALYLIQQHDYSGAEIMHLPLFKTDPTALVACPAGSRTEAWLHGHGVVTAPLTFRSLRHSGGRRELLLSLGRGLRSALELRRLLRRHPERRLVYCISLRPGMLAALAAIGLRRRVAWYVTDFVPPEPVGTLTRTLAKLGCHAAVATSQSVADDFVGRSRLLRRRCTTVTPGVDPARFDPAGAEPGAPRAAILGHVSPTKRTDLAVDVAGLVAGEVPEFRLEVVGRAQYRDEDFAFERALHRRVEQDPLLARRVRFQGYAGDVPSALRGLGLLLHCRPDEPFGVALIEAMAAGLPVVAPAAAGPAEIVEHEGTGLLYAPGDAGDAATQVLRLVRDRGLARRLGAAARVSVMERFDAADQTAQLAAVLAAQADAVR